MIDRVSIHERISEGLKTVTPDPPDDIPDELWGIVGNGHVVAVYQFRKDAEELKAHLPKSEIEFKVIRYVPDNDD